LNGAGVLIGEQMSNPLAPEYVEQFTDAVQSLAGDDLAWQRLHQRGLANAEHLTWDGVAAQWVADWLARFDQRTSNPWRMALHAKRIGDAEVAA
jgi:hypothetical protein